MMHQAARPPIYPFTAIVGQDMLKLALLINAVNPKVGGVLIRGEKGTAKSTAVRALAALLPRIDVVADCPYSCDPDGAATCPSCQARASRQRVSRPVRLVELPVGTTEDRLIGTLDLERAIKTGERHFEPGLIAQANRGILYIDEVNLLGDHLVDVLLDVAAMGVNFVEREGISHSHPAEFILIGTMNPEEGEIRPQLLDRFGLTAEVRGLSDPAARAEVVRRRYAFERDPLAFLARWQEAEERERQRILRARELLPHVEISDNQIDLIAHICVDAQVDGLRADITIHKAALTIAALEGRSTVTTDDIRVAAELALPHRLRRRPFEQPQLDREQLERTIAEYERKRYRGGESGGTPGQAGEGGLPSSPASGQGDDHGPATSGEGTDGDDRPDGDRVFAAGPIGKAAPIAVHFPDRRPRASSGRRSPTLAEPKAGWIIGAKLPRGRPKDLALGATLRAAAPYQGQRRPDGPSPVTVQIRTGDLREAVRQGRTGSLILFNVDASGSMGARERMAAAKGAVLALLLDAYQRRERVGLIAFRGQQAVLVVPPTRSVDLAEKRLRDLPTGGRTPLSRGLSLALETLLRAQRTDPNTVPLHVLVSDGRANVSLTGEDPIVESRRIAAEIAARGVQSLVIDCESGYVRLGLAKALSLALEAQYCCLDELTPETISGAVRATLQQRATFGP